MDYGALNTEQQGKLMSRINDLALVEDDRVVEEYAQSIRDFIDRLVWFHFITPQARTKYVGGIRDVMEQRQKRRDLKC